ncbi:MAG: EAL domain-containing protein [Clostridia bacterium]|nr:EAL domain-containing protein [Clostridia bacterium]
MLKAHEKIYSENGKRLILVADDEWINREILGTMLQDEYEIIYAENGQEALDQIAKYKNMLSLVLLDIMMPVVGGLEVIRKTKMDPELQHIPIIVFTSDQDSEVDSLSLGASDFIPKPYPRANVVLARIRHSIELSEDTQIISSTERDPLTGLYNKEFFLKYVEQYDHHHKDAHTDALVVDIYRFHMINERYGTAYADKVLHEISQKLRETVSSAGGIVCRKEADTFMIYCPSGADYKHILDIASENILPDDNNPTGIKIRLRMGVYADVDKTLEVERRFDRAKLASDSIRNNFTKNVEFYDNSLHEKELYAEQLIEEFPEAIRSKQFRVFFQPKFDIRPEKPLLTSAEALVRWFHPVHGMVSPGVFIPLFEENGLIQELDHYVWDATATQIRYWKDKYAFSVPVSVNVSRVDMYDPELINTLPAILKKYDLTTKDLLLEITESAYTSDADQIIEIVYKLRQLGFQVEMDDFGTGYSSLNMLSSLPLDALKLDMQFIRNAFRQKRDTRMLEIIIDIARYLSVPVIAEGVETEEQMLVLKEIGCDFVQGYYFSKPVPAADFEQFLTARIAADRELTGKAQEGIQAKPLLKRPDLSSLVKLVTTNTELIYYVNCQTEAFMEYDLKQADGIPAEKPGIEFFTKEREKLLAVTHPDDRDRLRILTEKDNLLASLKDAPETTVVYRLIKNGEAVYYRHKVCRTDDPYHIAVSVSNVDHEITSIGKLISETQSGITFSRVTYALSRDYIAIYYVNLETEGFIEFSSQSSYASLGIEKTGEKFFETSLKNIDKVIYEEDRSLMYELFTKENLLSELKTNPAFFLNYRLMMNGVPTHVRMKATMIDDKGIKYMVIAVNNIESEVRRKTQSVTYSNIAKALAGDYFCIYYVDDQTDKYEMYYADKEYIKLDMEKTGEDFFADSRKVAKDLIHPDDQSMFLEAFTKENIVTALKERRAFTLTYRMLLEDSTPIYVHMKITKMEDPGDPHIVVGISNISSQILREEEHMYALRLANHDALTGVKSKYAYLSLEKEINQQISAGTLSNLGVVFCDINGLKHVNDTFGHKAGDAYIKDACNNICTVFTHSPVYRIGGDEFVVILQGQDYRSRKRLVGRMIDISIDNLGTLNAVTACGLAEFCKDTDRSLSAVFERADADMYKNKTALKNNTARKSGK